MGARAYRDGMDGVRVHASGSSNLPIEVPDLNSGELSAASLIPVREIEENVQAGDPAHPFAAYLLGAARLLPYAGLPLSKSDSLNVFYQYYDAKADPVTGKGSVVASSGSETGLFAIPQKCLVPFFVRSCQYCFS